MIQIIECNHCDCDHEKNRQLRRIADSLEKLAHCVCKFVNQPKAVSSKLTFGGGNMASASILVGQTIQAIYTEFDGPNGSGNVVPPTGAVAFSSDNPAVATVDPASGMCTGVSAGSANISANDAGLAAPGLPASGVLNVAAAPPPVAVSSTLTFGASSAPAAAVRGPSHH